VVYADREILKETYVILGPMKESRCPSVIRSTEGTNMGSTQRKTAGESLIQPSVPPRHKAIPND